MIVPLLRKNLANSLVFSIKAQSFHWNVTGMLFSQLHEFFGEIYSGSYDEIDSLAEYIRIEGELAPFSLADIWKDKTIEEQGAVPGTAQEMIRLLANDNLLILQSLNELFDKANAEKKQGLADWVAGRIDVHAKWNWMLKSHLE